MEKSNTEKFVEEFKKAFQFLDKKKIIIYGIGINTGLLLKGNLNFQVVGLLDKDPENIGKSYYGKKVVSIEDIKNVDAIIIITQDPCYWKVIYKRIEKECTRWAIPVFFPDGKMAKIEKIQNKILENPYWKITWQEIREKLSQYEIISFDIFDTIIMRKVLYPHNVFQIVEKRGILKYKEIEGFAIVRKNAEAQLREEKNPTPSFDEIYAYIKNKMKLSEECIYYLKKEEICTEKQVLIPRKDMKELYYELLEQGKKIYFISDMYLSRQTIEDFLKYCGIEGYEQVIVSVEEKAKKSDGGLWKVWKNKIGTKKGIHIGDNYIADYQQPKQYGIEAIHIYSGRELLEKSSLSDIYPAICKLHHEVTMGCIVSYLFNSPFALSKSKGVIKFKTHEELGYILYAAPIYNYLIWILKETIEEKREKILFFARDGYVLQKVYQHIIEKLSLENAPAGIYFKISRMYMVLLSIYNRQDLQKVLKDRYFGTFYEFMKNRFFIDVSDSPNSSKEICTYVDSDKIQTYIKSYEKEIIRGAYRQRKRYRKYLASISLSEKDNFVISDPSYHGTNQYYFGKFIKKKIIGYYMYADRSKENPYHQQKWMKALFQDKQDTKAVHSNLQNNSTQFENAILVAPEGSIIGMNGRNEFIETPLFYTQRNFEYKDRMIAEIMRFTDDMLEIYKEIPIEQLPYDGMFIDALFGELISYKCEIEKTVRDTFYADTFYGTTFERKIWE